jgi:hypothetical protein
MKTIHLRLKSGVWGMPSVCNWLESLANFLNDEVYRKKVGEILLYIFIEAIGYRLLPKLRKARFYTPVYIVRPGERN